MRLVRYGPAGAEKPGILDSDGEMRDLSQLIADLTPAALSAASLASLAKVNPATLPRVSGGPRLGIPISGTGKFVAIGLNYADHAVESKLPIPLEPVIFTKAISSLCGPNDDVMLPPKS